jgi:hypothetical protein
MYIFEWLNGRKIEIWKILYFMLFHRDPSNTP